MERLASVSPAYQELESDRGSSTPLNARVRRRPNAPRIHGPQFISNMEGLILEMKADSAGSALSSRFTGSRRQQWLLQFDPSGTGSVALASLQDGRYLALVQPEQTVGAIRTPFHWNLVEDERGRYMLVTPVGDLKLTLPTPPGPCTVGSPRAESEEIKLIIVENTDENQKALRTGSIGPFAYPGVPVYYTHGSAGYITVQNHLNIRLYGAVSGSGSNAQWVIQPGKDQYWSRSSDASVHISTPIDHETGEQSVQVYEGRVGKTLHIQNLDSQETWRGVKYVPLEEARYTEDLVKKGVIGIKNDLAFDIHVAVFSTLQSGDTGQYTIKPGNTDFWNRDYRSEMVFVGVGSAPGLPKAYIGRPGFTLHIERW